LSGGVFQTKDFVSAFETCNLKYWWLAGDIVIDDGASGNILLCPPSHYLIENIFEALPSGFIFFTIRFDFVEFAF
jgi:hypothetical protein